MVNKFQHRSSETEMLDNTDIQVELLHKNLGELDFINRVLGGRAISIKGIKKLVTDKNKRYHIVDLGCGSGDTLLGVAKWARANGYLVELTGVDFNPDAINYLVRHCRDYPEIRGVALDYRDFLKSGTPVDIIHCSLFCHHLKDEELEELLNFCRLSSKTGFIINDLHRHWIAYYGVKIITHLLRGSKLSKNDGPVSVLRAFKRIELHKIIQKTQIVNYSVSWKWAFRFLIVGYNEE
jgi:SAM-dependent methyltransferase